LNNFIEVDCWDCLECCHFYDLVGEELTHQEIKEAWFFSEKSCDIYFKKSGDKYLIGDTCQRWEDGFCKIHSLEELPLSCAIFPLILTHRDDKVHIAIDKNCPKYNDIKQKFGSEDFMKKLFDILEFYDSKEMMESVDYDDLIECGYSIDIILDDIFSE